MQEAGCRGSYPSVIIHEIVFIILPKQHDLILVCCCNLSGPEDKKFIWTYQDC